MDGKHVGGTDDPMKFIVGRGEVVPGFDAAVLSMAKVGARVAPPPPPVLCFLWHGTFASRCSHVAGLVVAQGEVASVVIDAKLAYGDAGCEPKVCCGAPPLHVCVSLSPHT